MSSYIARTVGVGLLSVTFVTASCGQSRDTPVAAASSRSKGPGGRLADFLTPEKKVSIPAGTTVRVLLSQPVSSATAHEGDRIEATLAAPVVVDGVTALPAGGRVEGSVVAAASSGRLGGTASLGLELSQIILPGGGNVAIRSSRLTRSGKEHATRNVEIIGGGAAVGAILGQAIGKHTGSTLGGAAAGAAAGTGVAAATGDLNFTLGAGQELSFRLEEPVEVKVPRK